MNTKNLNGRMAAAALAMTAAVSAGGISVSAADYGINPAYPDPNTNYISDEMRDEHGTYNPVTGPMHTETGTSSTSGNTNVSSASVPSILTAETVSAVINNAIAEGAENVTVSMSADNYGNVTLREDTVAAIAAGDVNVTVKIPSGAGSAFDYTVEIDPSMVKKVDGSLNVAMKIVKTDHLSSVSGVYVPTDAVVISPRAAGDLGAAVKVTLPREALNGINKDKARLYAISKNGTVVKLDDDAISINSDGSVSVLIDNGDFDLVISDKDLVKAAEKAAQKSSKQAKSMPGTGTGAVAVGAVDASAVSAAAILSKKKKKKNK